MTKLDVRTPAAAPTAQLPVSANQEMAQFMERALKAAQDLAPLISREIEARQMDVSVALVALLLYSAANARAQGATQQEFVNAAEQAYGDVEELTATPVIEVLKKARAMIATGWCQGNLARKWVKDSTKPEGKRLVDCHVDDKYASRFSTLGAVEAAADSSSNRKAARELVLQSIAESWLVPDGSLPITAITDWNDHGWAPPLPRLVLPAAPPENASAETHENYQKIVEKMQLDYDTITVPQHPKPAPNPRTKEQVLAIFDRAIALAGGEQS
jgi:hypothetical protein